MRMPNGWTAAVLLGCLGWGFLTLPDLRAQDKPPAPNLDPASLDAAVYRTLRQVINEGADLYNSGDWSGCYRLYEGSLRTVRPFLNHRPGLQKDIDAAVEDAARSPQVCDRAFILRKVLDKIRSNIVATHTPSSEKPEAVTKSPKPLTLWDRLGGEKGVIRIVETFLAASWADPKVNFFRRPGYIPDEKELLALTARMVEYISANTGGPFDYKGKPMREAHKGMGITNAEFDAMAGHVRTALVRNGVQPKDVTLFMDLVESIRKDIVQPATRPPAEGQTLWQRIGGAPAAAKIVNTFIDTALMDRRVNFFRDLKYVPTQEQVDRLKKSFLEQFSAMTGGPVVYQGMSMKDVHAGMAITEAGFNAFLGHIRAALELNEVSPADATTILARYESFRKDIVKPADRPELPKKTENKPN